MKSRFVTGVSLTVALIAFSASAEEKPIKSGLQVGDSPSPFNPLHCNGKLVGEKSCLV
jgi:hypothetical protein